MDLFHLTPKGFQNNEFLEKIEIHFGDKKYLKKELQNERSIAQIHC